jgi:hypothetical protein
LMPLDGTTGDGVQADSSISSGENRNQHQNSNRKTRVAFPGFFVK